MYWTCTTRCIHGDISGQLFGILVVSTQFYALWIFHVSPGLLAARSIDGTSDLCTFRIFTCCWSILGASRSITVARRFRTSRRIPVYQVFWAFRVDAVSAAWLQHGVVSVVVRLRKCRRVAVLEKLWALRCLVGPDGVHADRVIIFTEVLCTIRIVAVCLRKKPVSIILVNY